MTTVIIQHCIIVGNNTDGSDAYTLHSPTDIEVNLRGWLLIGPSCSPENIAVALQHLEAVKIEDALHSVEVYGNSIKKAQRGETGDA